MILLPVFLVALQGTQPPHLNLSVAVRSSVLAQGPVCVVTADEDAQGATDLNGDGDAVDRVAQRVHLDAGTVTNLQIAADPVIGNDRLIVLESYEGNQGADLNLDGDLTDNVLYIHDVETGTTELVPYAVSSGFFRADVVLKRTVAFLVDESAHGGQDLNLDGDATDLVVFVYDALHHVTWNSHLAGFFLTGDRDTLAVLVSEVGQNQDLDGDGALQDLVLFVARPYQAGFVNTSLSCTFEWPQFAGGRVLVNVAEDEVGGVGQDLNNDGDLADIVAVVRELRSGTSRSLGLALAPLQRAELFGQWAAVAVWETAQNATDLNGDGDTLDQVVHVADLATQAVHNLGIVNATSNGSSMGLFGQAGQLYVPVPEEPQNTDLNGDSDTLDVVPHVYDAQAHVLTNVGLAVLVPAYFMPSGIGFSVPEFNHGNVDRNGDLDNNDRVAAFYSFATRTTKNLSLAFSNFGPYSEDDERGYAFTVSEQFQGLTDLNGDGDNIDAVAFIYDPIDDEMHPTGLAEAQSPAVGATPRGRYSVMAVGEFYQGSVDLNGDGDIQDSVLFRIGPIY